MNQQLLVMGGQLTSEIAAETHGKPAEAKHLTISDDGTNQLVSDERRLPALRHEKPEDGLDVAEEHANFTLNDNQRILMLLETQNKRRLMMAHQEQDEMAGDLIQQGQVKNNPDGPNPSLWSLALSSLPEKDRRIFKVADSPLPDATVILNDILLALEKQRDRCKRDRWTTISIGGKELVIRDICAKIAAHIKKFLAVVDVAVQFDPVHAALPWAGVRFLLQLTFNGFEIFGDIVEGLEKATRLIAQCGILETLVARRGSGSTDAQMHVEEEIVKSYVVVLNFLCKAKKHYDGSRLSELIP